MLAGKRVLFAAATALSVLIGAAASGLAAGTTVQVSLWDKGGNMAMPMGLGMAMHGKMAMATMGIDAKPDTAKAGEVTFKATNTSKDTVHEMVVAPVKDPNKPLPYIKSKEKVDEDAAGHLGEVAELEPGQSGALTLTMKPGTYILYCNIPGHYMAGMWTLFTVKP
jgi:uncharacterized cupredoxin-like copper-binding protein